VRDAEGLALCQDMTISRADFLRSLGQAAGDAPFVVAGPEIRHDDGERAWRIVLTPLADLVIGSIRLPRHRVAIHLAGYDPAAARRFLERFELYFRRGGG
jgi:hypothetical protein